jgi:hypothetical protein
MVDTWATGSCAQMVKRSFWWWEFGVLEPLQLHPVIIEDWCFYSPYWSKFRGKEAVLGANVC